MKRGSETKEEATQEWGHCVMRLMESRLHRRVH